MIYKVVEQAKKFYVTETRKTVTDTTEVVFVQKFSDRTEAKQFMRKLNGGCGFNGWTPQFFLTEIGSK